ncbi:MAG TPA: hypothetical protein VLM40_13660, partial [Gemmata sp.]|nr:hypothetical protein [Gemmata sp.]
EYSEWLSREEELKLFLSAHVPGPRMRFRAGLKVDDEDNWWRATRRGFPRFLEFDGNGVSGLKPMRELAKALENAFALLPTRWLVVRFVTAAQLAELLRQPVVEAIERITVQLGPDEAEGEEAAAVIGHSRLRNLRGAALHFPLTEVGAAALAQSANFNRMEQLAVEGAISGATVRDLGNTPWFRKLLTLDFGSSLTEHGFEELCRLDSFKHLHSLCLQSPYFPGATWYRFASATVFPALRVLNLGNSVFGERQAESLVSAPWLNLADLNLKSCAIGNAAAQALAAAPWLGSLQRLDLANNFLTPSGVAAVAGSRKLTALKYLDLSFNQLGSLGLQAIAKNPALHGLRALLLCGSSEDQPRTKSAPIQRFLNTLDMPELRQLSLANQILGSRAAKCLEAEKFHSLTRLDLHNCALGNATVSALLTAPALQNLIELDLDQNGLDRGLKPLAEPGVLPRLSGCDLSRNRITPSLRKRLLRRPGLFIAGFTPRGASPLA